MTENPGFANAKSYREFMESAQQVARLHDRRRSSVLQNINSSKEKYIAFAKEKRLEDDGIAEEDLVELPSVSSSEDDEKEDVALATTNAAKKLPLMDEDNVIVDLRASHLVQQQQHPSQQGYHNLEMALKPLYEIDLELHYDKKKRKIRKLLYPYLTRLQNSRNDKEYVRIKPILHNSGYANNSLWSKKSIQLEQMLRPMLLKGVNIPNLGSSTTLVGSLASQSSENLLQFIHENINLYNKCSVESNISMVDTFWSDDDSNPNLEVIHRITSSDGTAISQDRILHQETYRQLEFDLLLLNMVNDFSSLYKQIHSASGLEQFIIENNILHDNTNLIKVLRKKNEFTEAFNEIYAQHFNASKEEKSHESSEISNDGNYKCEGMLIAITASNDPHIRPLCTSADMSLAMNELQDSRVLREGYITMPHMLQMNVERLTEGFYRFDYHAKNGFTVKYMRINLPTVNKDLKPYVGMASYIMSAQCYEEEILFTNMKSLPTFQLHSISPRNRNKSQKQKAQQQIGPNPAIFDGSLLPPRLVEYCNHLVNTLNNIYRKYTKVILSIVLDLVTLVALQNYQKSSFVEPPHKLKGILLDQDLFQYRVLSIHHIEVRDCLTHFRRNAIWQMDGIQRHYLKEFYIGFRKEWNMIIQRNHTIENTEDFYGLSGAERAAIRYANKVYQSLMHDDNVDKDVFEVDCTDGNEFLKELEQHDELLVRERTHLPSTALINHFRSDNEELNNPKNYHYNNNNNVIQSLSHNNDPHELQTTKSNPSSSRNESRRPSKFGRKQSTFHSPKKLRHGSKLKESDSEAFFGMIKEIDPFDKERQSAAANFASEFANAMKKGNDSVQIPSMKPNGPFIDPFQNKLKLLCADNCSAEYHRSLAASTLMLLPSDNFAAKNHSSPVPMSERIKKIELLHECLEEEEPHQTLNPFPYLEKLNREAYRLAEKLDVLSIMIVGHVNADDKSLKIDVNNSITMAATLPDSGKHSPLERKLSVVPSLMESYSKSQQPSPAANTMSGSGKGFSFENPMNEVVDDVGSPGNASSIRAYLRRFSQRFAGLNIAPEYSDTDDSDSDGVPRKLGLTEDEKQQEEADMLEIILTSIDPKISERIRKGLALREAKLKLIRRQQYIRRRRQKEGLTDEQVQQLKVYYDNLPPNDDPFSSSSEEEEYSASQLEIDESTIQNLVGVADFKRARGNTIRKPSPVNINLEHRSTNVAIDSTLYGRLSRRESMSSSPAISRPNTVRPSILLGNVLLDGLILKDGSTPNNILEEMTDTLSSICDEVERDTKQIRRSRIGTFLVSRTGGKLWGDVGPTLVVTCPTTIPESITSSYSSGAEVRSRTSSGINLQIAHFATEYCYDLIHIALHSVGEKITNRKDLISKTPITQEIVGMRRRNSILNNNKPAAKPISIDSFTSSANKYVRKTKFNLVDEFNKIFEQPLNGYSIDKIVETKSDDEEVNISTSIFETTMEKPCCAIGGGELNELLVELQSLNRKDIDPLVSPSQPNHARPYSTTAVDGFQKFLNFHKPKSSYVSRFDYDQQTKSILKQKPHKHIASPPKVHQSVAAVVPLITKFGVKGISAISRPSNSLQQFKLDGQDVPESDLGFDESLMSSNSDSNYMVIRSGVSSVEVKHSPRNVESDSYAESTNTALWNAEYVPNQSQDSTNESLMNLYEKNPDYVMQLKESRSLGLSSKTDSDVSNPSTSNFHTPIVETLHHVERSLMSRETQEYSEVIGKTLLHQFVVDANSALEPRHELFQDSVATESPTMEQGDRIITVGSGTDKYFVSSMINSIYQSQASQEPSIVPVASPPHALRPSGFSPNQKKRMFKTMPKEEPHNESDAMTSEMEGVLTTSRPPTTFINIKHSDYWS